MMRGYDILCFKGFSLFWGMHDSSSICASAFIYDLLYVRYTDIFSLHAFNNSFASCFKQFACESLRHNYYISPNTDFFNPIV